jgi:hypothetical protein
VKFYGLGMLSWNFWLVPQTGGLWPRDTAVGNNSCWKVTKAPKHSRHQLCVCTHTRVWSFQMGTKVLLGIFEEEGIFETCLFALFRISFLKLAVEGSLQLILLHSRTLTWES